MRITSIPRKGRSNAYIKGGQQSRSGQEMGGTYDAGHPDDFTGHNERSLQRSIRQMISIARATAPSG